MKRRTKVIDNSIRVLCAECSQWFNTPPCCLECSNWNVCLPCLEKESEAIRERLRQRGITLPYDRPTGSK